MPRVTASDLKFLVPSTESAVRATVHTVVCNVQRRKQHNPVAIYAVLDGKGRVVDLLHHLGIVDINVEQRCTFVQCQALDVFRLAWSIVIRTFSQLV